VRGDTDLSGYEIRLKSAPVDRVAGVVRDEIGQPVRGTVRLLATAGADRQVLGDPTSGYFQIVEAEPGDGPLQASTTTAEDGSFEFPSVPSGDWRVAVDSAGRFGEVSTSVGRTDVGDLNIRLLRPVSFSMNVTVDWGGAPPSISLLSTLPGRKVSLPDGSIRLENVLPGRYRVIPLAGRSSYPASALFGGKEVLGQTIAFFAGSPELRILYKSATGSVSGIAPAGSTVALLSAAGYGRIARCDPSGAFSVATVAPGEYFVSAFDGFDASFLTDPELSTKIAARGTKVTVRTGPAASVEVKTIRWPE
jgi:hypothetical protein